ncbi:hypothetical protein [Chromohalobacter nigrandesensis]|uniref:hypothetical protein n=1 Tax=Chromohalobacter nigrandesensis TaxID=119863 RepID=UPI001FF3A371|nr:hypothetical protein [Chromohalobacter nigrandesensis]MCK0746311.1 hypothetical protein [Chromohalobacter nigrandesensis]
MKIVFWGLVINFLWWLGLINGLYMGPNETVPNFLIYLTGASWIVALLGTLIMLAGKRKAGFVLVIIGSLCFIPLGLVTIYGARRANRHTDEASLDKRRALAEK